MLSDPELLSRLRKSVRLTGLNADPSLLAADQQPMVVTNRLAQTTLRYLTNKVDPRAGQQLSEELRSLSGPEEYELLFENSGYTFFHVVQYLYEFAKSYARTPDRAYFCAGMGRGGGGLEVAPHTEFISLIRLLTTALPPGNDRHHLQTLIRELGPAFLNRIFTSGLLLAEVEPDGDNKLTFTLRYADRERLAMGLAALGHEGDTGAFFINSALHIQGLLQLAWQTFTRAADHAVVMEDLIENRSEDAILGIHRACVCVWTVGWRDDVELNRLVDQEAIFEQARSMIEGLQRKDLEYYLQRIKTLEVRIQTLERETFQGLIGGSRQMVRVYQTIQQVAPTGLTILIRGETGTGKELVARAVHQSSDRADGPFVAVNCAAFPETLLESELFGHERGAFTGADHTRPGRFERASGGTLFLDEIGDITTATQVKLLRVLEDQSFERIGGDRTITTDARILAATNRNLEAMIASGQFREDLYFRLNVLPIDLPPLRTRSEDIPQLAQHFLDRSVLRSGKSISGISRGAMKRLLNHTWPGNVRDLQNVIERAVIVYGSGETLTESHVNSAIGLKPATTDERLNVRQREILTVLTEADTCTLEELSEEIGTSSREGSSRRTFQNDLRALTNRGFVGWNKKGSARAYHITPEGDRYVQSLR